MEVAKCVPISLSQVRARMQAVIATQKNTFVEQGSDWTFCSCMLFLSANCDWLHPNGVVGRCLCTNILLFAVELRLQIDL